MVSERHQLGILYRDFLRRIVDLEVLSSQGDVEKLLGQFASVLAAFNFSYLVFSGPKYLMSRVPASQLRIAVASEFEFLVAGSMMVAGLFAVLAWNTVLPDRRDALILGLLPVRTRTVFLAKVAAIGSALAVAILAMNVFTGLTFPFLALPGDGGWITAVRSFAGYWLAMGAAGLFVFCGMLAIQGLAAQLLPYRLFVRFSSFLQLAAFFGALSAFFLKPPGAVSWLPSSWFFRLQQYLSGAAPFHPLAGRALWAMLGTCGVAAVSFALAYARSMRKIVEQPDIQPGERRRAARGYTYALLRRPIDRAIVLFTARTIARSRQHRLILAAYGGIGLAVALAYARDLLYGASDPYSQRLAAHWNQPNAPLLMAGVVLFCFAVVGARAVFSLPVALRANWIFQITAVHAASDYLSAIRKALVAVTVLPLWIVCAAAYFLIWPHRFAAQHLLVLSIAAVLLVHRSLGEFRKIPFACSYLPGKSNLHIKIGVYGLGFIALAGFAVQIEFESMRHPVGFAVFCTLLLAFAVRAWLHWRDFARSPHNWIQFEDVAAAEIESLDLHNPPPARPSAPPPPLEAGASIRPRSIFTAEALPERAAAAPLRVRAEQLWSDLRSGIRIFRSAPGLSAAAVALMAVGIGGNTAVFSLIDSILNKPAPGIRAERLVNITFRLPNSPEADVLPFSIYADFLAHPRGLERIAIFGFERMVMTMPEGTSELRGQVVTPNYFETLGVPIVNGRGFSEAEARGAGGLAAVIAYHVWQNQFQSAPDVAGRQVSLNGLPATIVGVAGAGFRGTHFAPNFEIAVPIQAYARSQPDRALAMRGVEAIGRLAPGVPLTQAQAEFDTVSRRIASAHPELARERIVAVNYSATAFSPWQSSQARMFMALLTVVALITLLVVCANVANLMLGRSAARQRELALRQSLGASRQRILALLFAEGLALAIAAAAAAGAFTWWVGRAIPALLPALESGARIDANLRPDWHVGIYALLLAILSAVVFTVVPSLRTWRLELLPFLKAGEHGVLQGRSWTANILVVVQLALCVVLLGGAGLATRSTALINAADLGYPRDHRLILRLNTLGAGSANEQSGMLEDLRPQIAAMPGVIAVSYATSAPPDPFGQFTSVAGQTNFRGMVAGPRYLEALGVRVQGRDFRESDLNRDTCVITRWVQDRVLGGQPAVGRTIRIFERPYEIIGVVPNAAYSGLREQGGDQFVFLSRGPGEGNGVRYFNVRYAGPVAAVAGPVRELLRDVSARHLVVGSIQSMDAFLGQYTAPALVISSVLSIFSVGSLIVAGIGLYAAIAFHTSRRTREFGVRMALGASSRQVLSGVLVEGLFLAAVGCGLGLMLSAGTSRLLGRFLFGVNPLDPLTWAVVVALLAAVSLSACYLPARRAGRIEPLEALRQE